MKSLLACVAGAMALYGCADSVVEDHKDHPTDDPTAECPLYFELGEYDMVLLDQSFDTVTNGSVSFSIAKPIPPVLVGVWQLDDHDDPLLPAGEGALDFVECSNEVLLFGLGSYNYSFRLLEFGRVDDSVLVGGWVFAKGILGESFRGVVVLDRNVVLDDGN